MVIALITASGLALLSGRLTAHGDRQARLVVVLVGYDDRRRGSCGARRGEVFLRVFNEASVGIIINPSGSLWSNL
jgi:hypothetical protein